MWIFLKINSIVFSRYHGDTNIPEHPCTQCYIFLKRWIEWIGGWIGETEPYCPHMIQLIRIFSKQFLRKNWFLQYYETKSIILIMLEWLWTWSLDLKMKTAHFKILNSYEGLNFSEANNASNTDFIEFLSTKTKLHTISKGLLAVHNSIQKYWLEIF